MSYFVVTHVPQGASAVGSVAEFAQNDCGPAYGYSAIAKAVREIVDNTTVIRIQRDKLLEIRGDPLRTLEEIDLDLQQKAAQVVDAWKNQPAFSLSRALAQIRRNLKR
jgi:hypothetical protein